MYKPFSRQRRISFWTACGFFLIIFPYGMIGDPEVGTLHLPFCVLLNAMSCALFGFMLYKLLIRHFPAKEYSSYAWYLLTMDFLHIVFARMNWGSWACIAVSILILAAMGGACIRSRKRQREAGKSVRKGR